MDDRLTQYHRLQATMTVAQEHLVVELRKLLLLSLDDLLDVTRLFINPEVSRSGMARCLRRYDISRLRDVQPLLANRKKAKPVKQPGHLDIHLRRLMGDGDVEGINLYLLAIVDRYSRWCQLNVISGDWLQQLRSQLMEIKLTAPFSLKKISFCREIYSGAYGGSRAETERRFSRIATELAVEKSVLDYRYSYQPDLSGPLREWFFQSDSLKAMNNNFKRPLHEHLKFRVRC